MLDFLFFFLFFASRDGQGVVSARFLDFLSISSILFYKKAVRKDDLLFRVLEKKC